MHPSYCNNACDVQATCHSIATMSKEISKEALSATS